MKKKGGMFTGTGVSTQTIYDLDQPHQTCLSQIEELVNKMDERIGTLASVISIKKMRLVHFAESPTGGFFRLHEKVD